MEKDGNYYASICLIVILPALFLTGIIIYFCCRRRLAIRARAPGFVLISSLALLAKCALDTSFTISEYFERA